VADGGYEDNIIAVHQLLAADLILKGGHGGLVSKWRPPDVEVNVVLKCIIFGGKRIIIHISPEETLE
jgi:hypothetical protein